MTFEQFWETLEALTVNSLNRIRGKHPLFKENEIALIFSSKKYEYQNYFKLDSVRVTNDRIEIQIEPFDYEKEMKAYKEACEINDEG